MTLPDERFRAIKQTRQFLFELADPNAFPDVPPYIRQQALTLLRHYPNDYDLVTVSHLAPEVFQEHMEPVTRMFEQYKQNKENS